MPAIAFLAPAVLVVTATVAGEAPRSAVPGRGTKLRLLVDKVMQPEEGWVTREWMVREAAAAGFNVFSPRRGHERLDEVRQVTRWCAKHGIYHMPWMRGSLAAPRGIAADGQRVLWADGNEQPLWSVCSDAFWEWTSRYIVEYAKMRAADSHLLGVFLDYENYWPGGHGNLYAVTYEDAVLRPFVRARGLTLPDLPPGGRKAWLEKQGLHEAFVRYEIAAWRRRCRGLREAVDRYAPDFFFCVYPAPGTPFILEACAREWGTSGAPVILADAHTYGRPSRFLPQPQALEANRRRLLNGMETARDSDIRFLYAGGIDPVVRGADAEFSGKNAVMISAATDGYWVFYEGPKYRRDHREYFRWFTWANERIRRGKLEAWHEPRETPESWVLDVFRRDDPRARLVAPAAAAGSGTGERVSFEPVRLRRENLILLAARRGRRVEVALRNVPVARYESLLAWEVRRRDGKRVAAGTIPHDGEGTVGFTPEADGIYLLGASAGTCAYTIAGANVPVGLWTQGGLHLIGAARRLYFDVPAGTKRFRVRAQGQGAETVRITVRRRDGSAAAHGETAPGRPTVDLDVRAGAAAGGGVWSLEVGRAAAGVLEDSTIRLDSGLAPVLSLHRAQVFRRAPGGTDR